MATKTRKRYTEEFKAQVVELLRTGKPVAELAEELCVSTDLLYRWRRGTGVYGVMQHFLTVSRLSLPLATRVRAQNESGRSAGSRSRPT